LLFFVNEANAFVTHNDSLQWSVISGQDQARVPDF
jgi:hypothetical protein